MDKAKRVAQSTPKKAAKKADGEGAVLAAITAMPGPDCAMGEQLHAIIKANAPTLLPRTWYGMTAYAKESGKIVCFFQSTQRLNTRYATFGFMHEANLDEGHMWPTAFALKELTAAEEAKIAALVKKATTWVYVSDRGRRTEQVRRHQKRQLLSLHEPAAGHPVAEAADRVRRHDCVLRTDAHYAAVVEPDHRKTSRPH
jgi:hypothetical protein